MSPSGLVMPVTAHEYTHIEGTNTIENYDLEIVGLVETAQGP
jgi:hypothetical protein